MKKVVEGSVADRQGNILPNDQVIEVSSQFRVVMACCDWLGVRLMEIYI